MTRRGVPRGTLQLPRGKAKLLAQAERLQGLVREVAELETRKAGLAAEMSAQRAISVRSLEAALEQTQQAATEKMDGLLAVGQAKLDDLAGRVTSLKLDAQRLQEGMLEARHRLEAELDTIKQRIREASEAAAKNPGSLIFH